MCAGNLKGATFALFTSRWWGWFFMGYASWLLCWPYGGTLAWKDVWAGVDGLPFRSLVSSSEAATSDMPIFWVWVKRNQRLWALLYPSMLRESRERSIKHQSSRNSLTHWVPDAALIGGMAEKGGWIVTVNGG